MRAVSGRRFCRVLESHGWELRRIKGSHHIYARTESSVRISVPVHGARVLKIGLQRHLMKLAEVDESEL